MKWDKELLKKNVRDKIGEHKFIIVSNREPFIHQYSDEGIQCITPASGMTTALYPIVNTCGGIWIAHGSGEADRDVVDERDHIAVPPAAPSFTLRRVWLSREEEEGYYYGYANEGLWPLCHIVYTRPTFREKDWEQYVEVNQRFAAAVLEELGDDTGFVFIQDYHFALLSRLIKEKRPDVIVAQFWHIPWPNREIFRACPQATELIDGLLGNDLLGFHIRHHCLNFLDTADRFIEARVDYERRSVTRGGKETLVRPFPISVDSDRIHELARSEEVEAKVRKLQGNFHYKNRKIGIGIDRIDYTKGIIERFDAIDRLLELHPEWVNRFIFLQLGPLSRIRIGQYKNYNDLMTRRAVDINQKWKIRDWQPIVLLRTHLGVEDVIAYHRFADICIVSSIHDGMNLVAKEFIASRSDLAGVLLLSRFTGSARELEEAVQINPLAVDQFAEAIHQGLTMDPGEKAERMDKLRRRLDENTIFRWAGKIVGEMKKLS
jgi:trehalose-6-phosphate synthase